MPCTNCSRARKKRSRDGSRGRCLRHGLAARLIPGAGLVPLTTVASSSSDLLICGVSPVRATSSTDRRGPAASRAAARRGHLRTPDHRWRCYGGRTVSPRDRRRRRATRPDPEPRQARSLPSPSRSTSRRRQVLPRPSTGLAGGAGGGDGLAREGGGLVDEELGAPAGYEDPWSTAIRRPQSSAQPRTCSRGKPVARRPTMSARSAGVRAEEMSNPLRPRRRHSRRPEAG